jgi:hypothetical protein
MKICISYTKLGSDIWLVSISDYDPKNAMKNQLLERCFRI